MSYSAGQRRLAAAFFFMAAGAFLSTGCVRRTVTINTKPEGATVTLNDEVIGTSPVTRDFLWYGDYGVILRKNGYETLETHQRLKPPWYQLPGIHTVTELFLPIPFHDRQQMTFEMAPAKEINGEQLIQDAKQFRDEALYGSD